MEGAACAGRPWVASAERSWEVALAKTLCERCPCVAECAAACEGVEAAFPPGAAYVGVWGGEGPAERAARRGRRGPQETKTGTHEPTANRGGHGTNGLYEAGCRCPECTAAHRFAMADYRERRRANGGKPLKPKLRHGTNGRYSMACRCGRCVDAHKQAMKEYRVARKVERAVEERRNGRGQVA